MPSDAPMLDDVWRRGGAGTARLELTVAAEVDAICRLRDAARAFAEHHGVASPDDVALAVYEACSNAVLHAYHEVEPGPIRLAVAMVEEGRCEVVVEDRGQGLVPMPARRGHGLGLGVIAQLCDALELRTSRHGGTQLRLTFGAAPAG